MIYDVIQSLVYYTLNIGTDTYSLLRNFLALVSPSSKTFEELFGTLKEYLKPQTNVIAERYKFYCRDQNKNETINEYIAVFQKLTLNCNFRGIFS